MVSPGLCVISGESADVTACLLGQILAPRGRTGLAALTRGFSGGVEDILSRLEGSDCRYAVVALPEGEWGVLRRGAETAVILNRGMGEAPEGLTKGCRNAVINLDDPDGAVPLPRDVRVWTISERRNDADVTAKNLRILPFRTEFEAVTKNGICRLSVPLPEGRGLYPGLAAAAAALTFGVSVEECARRLRRAEPVPVGMVPLATAGPFAAAGYFEPEAAGPI